jgi:hypothetical protein
MGFVCERVTGALEDHRTLEQTLMNVMMLDDEIEPLFSTLLTLPDDAVIVEWGCGGSTLEFVKRLRADQELISIEHLALWYDKVKAELDTLPDRGARVSLLLIPVDYYEPIQFGGALEETPAGCSAYLSPPINFEMVDMVFVDGIARGAALALIRRRCKPGTKVFLHDWVGREAWYSWAVDMFERVRLTNTLLELAIPK